LAARRCGSLAWVVRCERAVVRAWEPDAWDEFWGEVVGREWSAAGALLDLSPRVAGLAQVFVYRDAAGEAWLDWEAFGARAAADGLSSAEARLADLVVALTTGAPIALEPLARLGSWGPQVWRVLARWGTGRPLDQAPPPAGGRL
jgi:hypothetical protein